MFLYDYQNTFKLKNHTDIESKSHDLLGRDQKWAGFAGKGLVKAPAPPDLPIFSGMLYVEGATV
jgi:hypothetical protein